MTSVAGRLGWFGLAGCECLLLCAGGWGCGLLAGSSSAHSHRRNWLTLPPLVSCCQVAVRRGQRLPTVEGHGLGHAALPRLRHVRLHLALLLQQPRPGGEPRRHCAAGSCVCLGWCVSLGMHRELGGLRCCCLHGRRPWLEVIPCCCQAPTLTPPFHLCPPPSALQFLVSLQAGLTVLGNFTCWAAAYRIYQWGQEQQA